MVMLILLKQFKRSKRFKRFKYLSLKERFLSKKHNKNKGKKNEVTVEELSKEIVGKVSVANQKAKQGNYREAYELIHSASTGMLSIIYYNIEKSEFLTEMLNKNGDTVKNLLTTIVESENQVEELKKRVEELEKEKGNEQ